MAGCSFVLYIGARPDIDGHGTAALCEFEQELVCTLADEHTGQNHIGSEKVVEAVK